MLDRGTNILCYIRLSVLGTTPLSPSAMPIKVDIEGNDGLLASSEGADVMCEALSESTIC